MAHELRAHAVEAAAAVVEAAAAAAAAAAAVEAAAAAVEAAAAAVADAAAGVAASSTECALVAPTTTAADLVSECARCYSWWYRQLLSVALSAAGISGHQQKIRARVREHTTSGVHSVAASPSLLVATDRPHTS